MQPPAFWRDLEAKFQGLPDSVWANRDAPDRLHMSDGKVRGGDASLRSRFKNVAGLGGMALCADRGFGADVFDGVWMWEDAVTAYLKEEKKPLVHGVSVYALEAWSSRETGVGSFRDSSTTR